MTLGGYFSAQAENSSVYLYARCGNCNCLQINQIPDPDELAAAYNEPYYGENRETKFPPIIENAIEHFRISRARRASRLVAHHSNVLDIGCGNGKFLFYLSQCKAVNIHGVELPGAAADRARAIPKINLHLGNLEDQNFIPGQFSLISMFHVIEHVPDPIKIITLLSQLLAPDGHLMLSFPNADSAQARIFGRNWFHLDPPRHLHIFSANHFELLMKRYGFALVKKSFFSLEQNAFGYIQSFYNLMLPRRDCLYQCLKSPRLFLRAKTGGLNLLAAIFAILLTPLAIIADVCESLAKRGATVEFIFRKQ